MEIFSSRATNFILASFEKCILQPIILVENGSNAGMFPLKLMAEEIHGSEFVPNLWKAALKGYLYWGELAQLGGLACLSEISPSLRNSYKNVMCSYESEPARLDGISLDFAGIPPRRDENFPYEHAQVGQPGKVG